MDQTGKRKGYALIVVLGTLSIIALLIATSSSRLMTRMQHSADERLIARAQDRKVEVATLALALGPPDRGTTRTLPGLTPPVVIDYVDVGGLLDLNTAAPAMLDRFAKRVGITPSQLDAYRAWRQRQLRLQSTQDFIRVTGADPALAPLLNRVTTVYSSRFGISADHAPDELLRLIAGSGGGDRAQILRDLPDAWVTDPVPTTYRLFETVEGQPVSKGTIQLPVASVPGRVLDLE